MAANGKPHGTSFGHDKASDTEGPAWADGLKQLYDNVVDEPIPDTFKDLLAQLDADDGKAGSSGEEGNQ